MLDEKHGEVCPPMLFVSSSFLLAINDALFFTRQMPAGAFYPNN